MMEWGPIKALVAMMIPFLTFSYNVLIPNYGVAIILLTLVIKVAFFPLMNKQYASMKAMQKINPEMQKIREKYKAEPQKMQMEVMALYKRHNVNPLSGCLPMLVQIPFFLAIYATIISPDFLSLIQAPGANPGLFSFWLADLAAPDQTYILPVLLGIFTYYSQKMVMTDPTQRKMLLFSPILILFFGLRMPSGVLLYWAVSTLVSAAQQVWVFNQGEKQTVEVIKAS